MQRRAELVEETRQRITEAAVRLHTTIGPANTSLSAVAEEAGVTRLTVYRHFADLDELFEACSGHWRSQNPAPDADAWARVADLEGRARRAFGELYAWYEDHGNELYPIYRDWTALTPSIQARMAARDRTMADALVRGHAPDTADGRGLRAIAGLLVSFQTWRSLRDGQGLAQRDVVDIAVRTLTSVAGSGAA